MNEDIELPLKQVDIVKQMLIRDLIEKRLNNDLGLEVALLRDVHARPLISFDEAYSDFCDGLTPTSIDTPEQSGIIANMNDQFITLLMRIGFDVDIEALKKEILAVTGIFDAQDQQFPVQSIEWGKLDFKEMVVLVFRIYSQEIIISLNTAVALPKDKPARAGSASTPGKP